MLGNEMYYPLIMGGEYFYRHILYVVIVIFIV